MPKIAPSSLVSFAESLLHAGGASAKEARVVARSLVDANMKGYDSHGVMRIPYYVEAMKTGEAVTGAELKILDEGPSRVVADANWGFGQVQAVRMLTCLSVKAHDAGQAIGTMTHCGHIGRLGEYCEMAADDGLVSMLMVNSHGGAARVAPPGGKEPRLSTNPLAIGVPHRNEPLVLDFSTSATAEGKVRVKKIAGEKCPDGWIIDSEGRPTNDPNVLYQNPQGSILPMGGAQAYKGFGLGLMVEIFTGAISGGVCAKPVPYPKKGNCVFMMLLDPARYGGREHFHNEVEQLVEYIQSCPRIEGVQEILLPGDPERRLSALRSAEGVPLDPENWKALVRLAETLHVAIPPVH
ncbi:MAG TPA: Ldh family oxidoreductase [Pirellulaceae bacterium]|nr:Ldh family oxidoreductase [Pirellulaceae bacterium]